MDSWWSRTVRPALDLGPRVARQRLRKIAISAPTPFLHNQVLFWRARILWTKLKDSKRALRELWPIAREPQFPAAELALQEILVILAETRECRPLFAAARESFKLFPSSDLADFAYALAVRCASRQGETPSVPALTELFIATTGRKPAGSTP